MGSSKSSVIPAGLQPEIEKSFIVSNMHIEETTAHVWLSLAPHGYDPTDYGWTIYVPSDVHLLEDLFRADDPPRDLKCLMQIAHELGCRRLIIDRDGSEYPQLPIYEW